MIVDAKCSTCVFFKLVNELLEYRCSKGKRQGNKTALSEPFVCELWKPSIKDMRIWITRAKTRPKWSAT